MFVGLFLLDAQAASQPAPPAAQQQQDPAPKMECRSIMEPGSRIPSRVCRLSTEWEAMAKATQDDLRSSRNQRGEGLNPH